MKNLIFYELVSLFNQTHNREGSWLEKKGKQISTITVVSVFSFYEIGK